jgi:murein DD-endopeptidase MepM/ murein hydrolase activator NlpD
MVYHGNKHKYNKIHVQPTKKGWFIMEIKRFISPKALHNYILPIILLLFANSTLLFSALSPQQNSTQNPSSTGTAIPTTIPLSNEEIVVDSASVHSGVNPQHERPKQAIPNQVQNIQSTQDTPTPPPNPTITAVPDEPPPLAQDNAQTRVSVPVQQVADGVTERNSKEQKTNSTTLELDPSLEQAVKQETLNQRTPEENTTIFVSAINQVDNWVFGTSTLIPSDPEDFPVLLLFFAELRQDIWRVSLEYTNAFERAMNKAPLSLLTPQQRLIMQSNIEAEASPQAAPSPQGDGSLQFSLPWATGETQSLTGGPHGENPKRVAIDFSGGSGVVRTVREGTAYIPCGGSSDYVRVDHGGGVSTNYYHLSNLSVGNGVSIARGTALGRHNLTASCLSGSATGAHVHFWHSRNGVNQAWHGVDLGGWTVLNGTNEYQGCMRRVRDNHQVCATGGIYNEGTIGTGTAPNQEPNSPIVHNSIGLDFRSVTLSWQDAGDPDNGPRNYRDYYVRIWHEDNSWRQESGWITATSWTVTLPITGRYLFEVQAGDGAAGSSNNPQYSFIAKLWPQNPTDLVIVGSTTSSLSMTWRDNANDEAGYRVYRWRGEDDTWILVGELAANSTSYTDHNLNCDTAYYYKVSAANENRESLINDWTRGITNVCEKPRVPGDPYVSNTSTSTISIRWEDRSNDETGFHIYRWENRNNAWDFYKYATVGSNVTQFTDTKIACLTERFYLVTSFNQYGESAHSEWTKGTTLDCINTPPNPPIVPDTIYWTYRTINLTWDDGGDPDYGPRSFRDYIVTIWNEDGSWSKSSGWITATNWDVTLPRSGKYYFTVFAGDGEGISDTSYYYWFNPSFRPLPPTNFKISATAQKSITMTWSLLNNDEQGFRVYRWRADTKTWALIGSVGRNISTFTDTTVNCGQKYEYRLAAYNTKGETLASSSQTGTTQTCPTATPQPASTATPKPAPTATPKPAPAKTYRIALPFVRR